LVGNPIEFELTLAIKLFYICGKIKNDHLSGFQGEIDRGGLWKGVCRIDTFEKDVRNQALFLGTLAVEEELTEALVFEERQ
jgi:hypothetical protein